MHYYVYIAVIDGRPGHFKVGKSKEPPKREGTLNANPYAEHRIVMTYECDSEAKALGLEAALKDMLKDYRFNPKFKEYFAVQPAMLAKIVGSPDYLMGMLRRYEGRVGEATIEHSLAQGKVRLRATVYENYVGSSGETGRQAFMRQMAEIGAAPPDDAIFWNSTSGSFLGGGPKAAWTGDVMVESAHPNIKGCMRRLCSKSRGKKSKVKKWGRKGFKVCNCGAFMALAPLLWPRVT